jgi:hypothetical protein
MITDTPPRLPDTRAIRWLPSRWHYAWVIVAVYFAVTVVAAGVLIEDEKRLHGCC